MSSKPRFVGEKVKLGEVISKAKVERCGNRSFPVYSMTMHDGIVEQSGRFKKTIASRDTSSYKVVKKNQLVVGFPIDEGVIYVQNHDQPGIMSPAYNVWDFDSDRILPAYLEFALHSPQSMAYYAEKMRGTTARRRTLTGDALKNMSVPVPSIEDQYAVVKTLNCIRSQLAATHQMLDKLDHLVKSRFAEMFLNSSWPIATIGECSMDIHYGTSEKASTEGEYVYLRMNNMGDDGSLDLSDIKRITLEGKALSNCLVRKGDLLFNRTNSREKVGKTCVFCLDEPMVIAGYIIRVRLDDRVDSTYLAAYMNLSSTKALLRGMAKGAVHQANINAKQLASIKFPLADIKAQKEFVSFVSQVDKSRFIAQQQIEKLQMLYDSLAQDYFGD